MTAAGLVPPFVANGDRPRPGVRHWVDLAEGAWRYRTSRWRAVPDYVIIGASRSGTTFLARRLRWHPDVVANFTAHEVHYYDHYHEYGDRWYRMHFPLRVGQQMRTRRTGRRALTGEKTPGYLPRPVAAAGLAALNPEVRLVVVVREPVDRAWSWYRKLARDQVETRSAHELMADAIEVADGPASGPDHELFPFVAGGRYADLLEPWRERFGPDQLKVWRAEDLYAGGDRVLREVLVHIGADPALAAADPGDRSTWAAASPAPDDFRARYVPAFDEANRRLAEREGISWP